MSSRTKNLRVIPLDQTTSDLLSGAPVTSDFGARATGSLNTAMTETGHEDILRRYRQQTDRSYILEWTGDRTPRGAIVGGHIIEWTQNGMVRNVYNEDIGTYERLIDGDCITSKDHKMAVMLFRKEQE